MKSSIRLKTYHSTILQRYCYALLASFCLMFLASCANHAEVNPRLTDAIRWYTGEAGSIDDIRARALLEHAALGGDALSVMWLARVYSTGRMTFTADKAKAIEIAETVINEVERMAIAGVGEANFLMGTAYAEGLAVEVDPVEAVKWYRIAAAQNITLALHNLGNVHASGSGVEQSDSEAVYWWKLAALKGDAIPQFRLAKMLEQGKGVEKDLIGAVHWYRESSRRGYQNATAALERLDAN